jgi:hypothetical protein
MIEYKPVSHHLTASQNLFWIIFVFTGILWLIFQMLYHKRFNKNIKVPNIYIFEYESQSGKFFTLYNILSFITSISVNLLIIITLINAYFSAFDKNKNIFDDFLPLILSVIIFLAAKKFLSFLYLFITKKNAFFSKIIFIRRSFEVYKNFYGYLLSFLIWFFPIISPSFFYIFLSISGLWYLSVLLKTFHNFIKHTGIGSFQLFLYLCISEILPLIILIWWISFQII